MVEEAEAASAAAGKVRARGRANAGTAANRVTAKQAVVVIHGIGEQAPLQTLRSFVETVYERDTALTQGMTALRTVITPNIEAQVKQTWIVPDDATGTAELRRISTPPDDTGLRTDFFEFYWADIMNDTPVSEALDWIKGLLLRSPFAIPRDVRVWIAWLALWVITIGVVAFALATFDTGQAFEAATKGLRDWVVEHRGIIGALLILIGLVLVLLRFLDKNKPLPRIKLVFPVALVVAGVLVGLVPESLLGGAKVWSAGIAALLAAALNGIIGPFVGDIVRYVRATPKTVGKRKEVRERGLALLEALHKRDPVTNAPDYERIIVVGHSLGTIIGYDLVQLYWEKAGPTHHRPPLTPASHAAMSAVDVMVKQCWVDGQPPELFDLDEFQRRQAILFEELRTHPKLDFRISDFITLGSPLTHADFLTADDDQQLKENFDLRLISSSPPRQNSPWKTMIYGSNSWHALRKAKTQTTERFLHFAAPFAAVRWTNIFDYAPIPMFGDVISGPVAKKFGPGVREYPVTIYRPGRPWLWRRLVTHTLYWGWDTRFATAPDHIAKLRKALDLRWTRPSPDGDAGDRGMPPPPTSGWDGPAPEGAAVSKVRPARKAAGELVSGSANVPIAPETPWEEERPDAEGYGTAETVSAVRRK